MQLAPWDAGTDLLPALDDNGALAANERLRELVAAISDRGESAFRGSKPHVGPLSPGCVLCGEGRWSCLFVNAVCDAGCFFCPGHHAPVSAPVYAERITIPSPTSYAAYVRRLGFAGVSFSGGEPLVTLDRTLDHLRAVRGEAETAPYVWAYTNGKQVTPERVRRLASAGLDELRFNIVHTGYDVEPVRAAVGLLPRVTVEIPAIPEDAETLRRLLPELRAAGVDHLNLHQLMVLGDNAARLRERGYTFLRFPTLPVVESELSALETLVYALDHACDLPINYCGAVFKGRWQNRVDDLRAGPLVAAAHEVPLETGLRRRLWVETTAEGASADIERLRAAGADELLWVHRPEARALDLHPDLLGLVELGERNVYATYIKTLVGDAEQDDTWRSSPGYAEVAVDPSMTVGVRSMPVTPRILLGGDDVAGLRRGEPPAKLECYERIPGGLPEYTAG